MSSTEEYLDVLDEQGKFTGVSRPRSEVHRLGLWHRVAHVWIVNSKGEMIVQKRSEKKESWPGLWDISCAGHCSAGDSSLVSAQRELEEELGLIIASEKLTFLFTETVNSVLNGGKYLNKEFIDVYLLELEVDLKTLVLQESEVSGVQSFYYKDLMQRYKESDATFVPIPPEGTYYKQLFAHIEKRFKR